MVASTVKSTMVTNLEASPITVSDRRDRGMVKCVIDKIALTTASIDEANDLILLAPIPSSAKILDVEILNDDLDSHSTPTLAADVGLAYSGIGGTQKSSGNTSGTAVDVDVFGTAVTTLQAAHVTWTSVRFEADDIVDVTKEAWEAGGLSSDPGGLFYVSLKVTNAAATAVAGDVVVRVTYLD